MYYLDKRTLEFYNKSPIFRAVSFYTSDAGVISISMGDYLSKTEVEYPEGEAGRFYLLNHTYSLLCNKYHCTEIMTPKEVAISGLYLETFKSVYERLFYYMLGICLSESRHVKKSDSFYDNLQSAFGVEVTNYAKKISGKTRVFCRETFIKEPPAVSIGKLVASVHWVFSEGKFSGGYGGSAWATIAKTLLDLIEGKISPIVFVDTAFTLAHNNGPIFNKNFLYHTCDKKELVTLLDVQRAGQVPQYILGGGSTYNPLIALKKLAQSLALDFPEFYTPVDWQGVMDLGSVGKYYHLLNKTSEKVKSNNPNVVKFYITDTEYAECLDRAA